MARCLGLLDQALGLGGGAGVVLGRLAGQPLLLHGQGAAGLLDLALGGGPGLLGLAGGAGAQRVGLLLGGQPELLGLALGGGQQVVGLGRGHRALLLDVGDRAAAGLVELLELDHPHVLGVAVGLGLSASASLGGLLADLVGLRLGLDEHLVGLLLGQAQHLAGLAAEPGVRRVLVLLEIVVRSDSTSFWSSPTRFDRWEFSPDSALSARSTAAVS